MLLLVCLIAIIKLAVTLLPFSKSVFGRCNSHKSEDIACR